MTNSLSLGCDCKGSIHYLDAHFPTQAGEAQTIANAICIHEEDSGILFKHWDFRDESVIVTRARKLIVQQIFTAANYEYAIQVCNDRRYELVDAAVLTRRVSVDLPCELRKGDKSRGSNAALIEQQQDGTIQPEIKLTGILNTYAMDPDEDTHGWGTQVHTGARHTFPSLHAVHTPA